MTTSTTGSNPDPDGYSVSLDGNSASPIGTDATVSFTAVSTGSHTVTLSGLAANCSTTNNPQTVTVTAGATTQAAFSVACTAPPSPAYTLVGASNIASCSWDSDELTAQVLDGIVAQDPNTTVFNAGDVSYDGASTASELANCYGPSWGRHKARTYVALGNNEYKTDPNPDVGLLRRPGRPARPRLLQLRSRCVARGDAERQHRLRSGLGAGHVAAAGPRGERQHVHDRRVPSAALRSGAASSTPSRKPIWDRLYAAGVELVLNGHRTWYERFAPQTPDGTGDNLNGIREFVVGTGGFTTAIDTPTAANVEKQGNTRGVLKLTLTPGGYAWQFVTIARKTFTDTGSGTCH